METKTNTLENFTVYRDGEISHWETMRPQIRHNFRSFGNRLWTNACEFGRCIDDAIPQAFPEV